MSSGILRADRSPDGRRLLSTHQVATLAVGFVAAVRDPASSPAGSRRPAASARWPTPTSARRWAGARRSASRCAGCRPSSGSASSSGFFVLLGSILFVIPGIYLYVAFTVAVPVLLVEGAGPWRALGRSRQLVQGRWWGTLGVALVGYLLVTIVTLALTGVVVGVAFANPARNTVTGFVAQHARGDDRRA